MFSSVYSSFTECNLFDSSFEDGPQILDYVHVRGIGRDLDKKFTKIVFSQIFFSVETCGKCCIVVHNLEILGFEKFLR